MIKVHKNIAMALFFASTISGGVFWFLYYENHGYSNALHMAKLSQFAMVFLIFIIKTLRIIGIKKYSREYFCNMEIVELILISMSFALLTGLPIILIMG